MLSPSMVKRDQNTEVCVYIYKYTYTPMFWSLLTFDSDNTRVFINMPVCAIYMHVCNLVNVIFSVICGAVG